MIDKETHTTVDPRELERIITKAKSLAIHYRLLTGRPLGITGEVAEYEAARLLNLRLAVVRQAGFDAIRDDGTKLQIKGRCILDRTKGGQRIGSIKLEKEWDVVLLVILDADFEPIAVYEAQRPAITAALLAPGSKARNERGALSMSKFKSIGELVWSCQ
jgi:Family of unknown function (DUF6998)